MSAQDEEQQQPQRQEGDGGLGEGGGGGEEPQAKVNFSCRIARCARDRTGEDAVDIIKLLREEAGEELLGRMGESFARGHKEASGGIVPKDVFEEFVYVPPNLSSHYCSFGEDYPSWLTEFPPRQKMGVGEKKRGEGTGDGDSPSKKNASTKSKMPAQKNNLMNYFGVRT